MDQARHLNETQGVGDWGTGWGMRGDFVVASGRGHAEDSIGENPCPEAATAFHLEFGAWVKGGVHPVARGAFLGAEKADALDFEFLFVEGGEIDADGDDIAAEDFGAEMGDGEDLAEIVVDFAGEESDLAFVIGFEVGETIPEDAATGEASDFGLGDQRGGAWGHAVMSVEGVLGGGKDLIDVKGRRNDHGINYGGKGGGLNYFSGAFGEN